MRADQAREIALSVIRGDLAALFISKPVLPVVERFLQ
jgi:hypothetical protein